VYARETEGAELSFGVSGKLIMNALVMYDHQTRTLWSQILGEGVKGPLKGTKLEFVPVTHTEWSLWREAYPDTLVLDKGGRYSSDRYESYYRRGVKGVLGEAQKDGRLRGKSLVLGIELGDRAKAYPFNDLLEEPVLNDSVAGQDIVVFMERGTETALAYDRRVDGRSLTFSLSPEASGARSVLIDDETGSRWMAITGQAIDGPLKDKRLERVPSHLSFWFAWKDWNPHTDLYRLSGDSPPGT
jgi:hypothetical protein